MAPLKQRLDAAATHLRKLRDVFCSVTQYSGTPVDRTALYSSWREWKRFRSRYDATIQDAFSDLVGATVWQGQEIKTIASFMGSRVHQLVSNRSIFNDRASPIVRPETVVFPSKGTFQRLYRVNGDGQVLLPKSVHAFWKATPDTKGLGMLDTVADSVADSILSAMDAHGLTVLVSELPVMSPPILSMLLICSELLKARLIVYTNQVAKPALGTQLLCSASRHHTRSRPAPRLSPWALGSARARPGSPPPHTTSYPLP